MPTYFGFNSAGVSSAASQANYEQWHNPAVFNYTCPGSGSQLVVELSLNCKYVSDATKHIAVALYSAAGSLICQSQSVVVNSSTAAWFGTTSAADMSPANTTITGGAQYILCFNAESDDTRIGKDDVTNCLKYEVRAYASGFEATLPTGTLDPSKFCMRCGVDPAGVVVGSGLSFSGGSSRRSVLNRRTLGVV